MIHASRPRKSVQASVKAPKHKTVSQKFYGPALSTDTPARSPRARDNNHRFWSIYNTRHERHGPKSIVAAPLILYIFIFTYIYIYTYMTHVWGWSSRARALIWPRSYLAAARGLILWCKMAPIYIHVYILWRFLHYGRRGCIIMGLTRLSLADCPPQIVWKAKRRFFRGSSGAYSYSEFLKVELCSCIILFRFSRDSYIYILYGTECELD